MYCVAVRWKERPDIFEQRPCAASDLLVPPSGPGNSSSWTAVEGLNAPLARSDNSREWHLSGRKLVQCASVSSWPEIRLKNRQSLMSAFGLDSITSGRRTMACRWHDDDLRWGTSSHWLAILMLMFYVVEQSRSSQR